MPIQVRRLYLQMKIDEKKKEAGEEKNSNPLSKEEKDRIIASNPLNKTIPFSKSVK